MSKQDATKQTYADVRTESMKPFSQRKEIVTGRGGRKVKPRRYLINDKVASKMRKVFKDTGEFQNPHRLTGLYGICTQSLINLGIDKMHSLKDVKAEAQKLMCLVPKVVDGNKTNAWIQFKDRKSGNPETGKDVNGRLIQTFEVLQRLGGKHPYGAKLSQMGACIDIDVDIKKQYSFMLHTGFKSRTLVKPSKVRAVAPKAKAKAKAKKVTPKATPIVKADAPTLAPAPVAEVSVI